MIFFFFFKNLFCFSIRRGLTLISVGLDQLSTTRTSSRQGFPNHGERSPEISFFYLAFSIVSVTGVSHLGLGHAKLNRKRRRHDTKVPILVRCHRVMHLGWEEPLDVLCLQISYTVEIIDRYRCRHVHRTSLPFLTHLLPFPKSNCHRAAISAETRR